MNLIRFAISNPVKVIVAVVFVLLGGWTAIKSIPIQLIPNVDRPIVTVRTRWDGASPREIEREIVEPQEEQLKKVADLYKMISESDDSRAKIELEFNVGVDKEAALREVSEKLDLVRKYPDGVDEQVVEASDSALSSPIAWLHIQADDARDISELQTWVDDHVQPLLKRVKGVASVGVWGGREREIQVVVDPAELSARRLTFRDVELALRGQNTNVSAGTIATGKRDFTYRTIGQYTSLDEIANTVIAYASGGPVYVREVAEVRNDFKKQYSFIRSKRPHADGAYSLSLPVRRESGSNVLEVINGRGDREVTRTKSGRVRIERNRKGVKDVIEEVNANLLNPRGLHMKMNYDESRYIAASIDQVRTNVFVGAVLAILVLLLFLRSVSATAVVAAAIPISAVGTFLGVYVLGRSLNVIMLAGVTFAVGMVVDNAIVVLENIYRHREMGKNRIDASIDGAREVWGAVLASTLTTMAVFIPVIFVKEEAGQLFRDIAIAISVGVGLSLIVAVTVIPTLSARILRKAGSRRSEGRGATAMATWVYRLNGSVAARVFVVVALTVGSIVGSMALMPAMTYLPAGNRNFVRGRVLAPPGYTLDTFRKFAEIIEQELKPYWDADVGSPQEQALREKWIAQVRKNIIPDIEANDKLSGLEKAQRIREVLAPPPPIETFYLGSYYGSGFLGLASKDPDVSRPLANLINSIAPKLPGAYVVASQSSLFGRGTGNSVELEVVGDDLPAVTEAARAAFAACQEKFGRPPVPDPRTFDQGRPEVRILPDRERAADLGLSVRDVGFIVEACVDGALVGEYRDRGDAIDLAIKVDEAYASGPERVSDVPIVTPSGQIIPLGAAVNIIRTTSPQSINHIEERPAVSLRISPPEGAALEDVMASIEDDIIAPLRAEGRIPESITTTLAGNANKLEQTRNALLGRWSGWNLDSLLNLAQSRIFMALLVTYFVMAGLFESFIYPFVVMFSVPLAAVGGFAGLAIVHQLSLLDPTQPVQLMDILTMLGFVLLIGVVVNNAILLVHQARNNMLHGRMPPREAISASVRTRIRPIFMSTMTSVCGMLPLVLRGGAGSELYRGIGSVVVGGLLVSTVFTLLLVPALLSLVLDARNALLPARGRTATLPPTPDAIPTETKQP